MFADVGGKVGHRRHLWAFHSSSAVRHELDRTRAGVGVGREPAGALVPAGWLCYHAR